VQHERVSIGSQLGNNEWHPLRHEAAYEMYVAAQAIELGNDHGALEATCGGECSSQFRTPIQRIAAFAGFYLDELAGQDQAFPRGEGRNRFALCFNPES
jgi:hypothetical protein